MASFSDIVLSWFINPFKDTPVYHFGTGQQIRDVQALFKENMRSEMMHLKRDKGFKSNAQYIVAVPNDKKGFTLALTDKDRLRAAPEGHPYFDVEPIVQKINSAKAPLVFKPPVIAGLVLSQ